MVIAYAVIPSCSILRCKTRLSIDTSTNDQGDNTSDMAYIQDFDKTVFSDPIIQAPPILQANLPSMTRWQPAAFDFCCYNCGKLLIHVELQKDSESVNPSPPLTRLPLVKSRTRSLATEVGSEGVEAVGEEHPTQS
jgi:hypothetical protein